MFVPLKNTLTKFLVTTTPVNKLTKTPIAKVIANPLTGPLVTKKFQLKGFIKTNKRPNEQWRLFYC